MSNPVSHLLGIVLVTMFAVGCATTAPSGNDVKPQASAAAYLYLSPPLRGVDGKPIELNRRRTLEISPGKHTLHAEWQQGYNEVATYSMGSGMTSRNAEFKKFSKNMTLIAEAGNTYRLKWVMVHPTKATNKLTPGEQSAPRDPGTQSATYNDPFHDGVTFYSKAWPNPGFDNAWHGPMTESVYRLEIENVKAR